MEVKVKNSFFLGHYIKDLPKMWNFYVFNLEKEPKTIIEAIQYYNKRINNALTPDEVIAMGVDLIKTPEKENNAIEEAIEILTNYGNE